MRWPGVHLGGLVGQVDESYRIRVKGSIGVLFGSREALRFARFGSREKKDTTPELPTPGSDQPDSVSRLGDARAVLG
jgi:hypothetical protein